MQRVLVTGANGQIGSELVQALRQQDRTELVVGADLTPPSRTTSPSNGAPSASEPHEILDVRDREALREIMKTHAIDTVFHLASLLSAVGEEAPDRAWTVNAGGLKNVLDLARSIQEDEGRAVQIFWPSSIAAFGPATGQRAAQQAVLDPQTMYGVTKVSGEFLCRYYYHKYDVDVRSVRYPGLISHAAPPGGGTTDYAPEMCFAAAEGRPYTCFVEPETRLPMMYMPDALHAALALMNAPAEALSVRTSYNVGAIDFTAQALADALSERVPAFECRFAPDERQKIADSWPASVDDQPARDDWNWNPQYDLEALVDDMLKNLRVENPTSKAK